MTRQILTLSYTACFFLITINASKAQEGFSCVLGRVKENVTPRYTVPPRGASRFPDTSVQVLATFAPDGHVTKAKVLSGAQYIRFDADAYVRGWRAEANETARQCTIKLDYQLELNSTCTLSRELHVRPERLDDNHVLMHLECDPL